MCELASIAYVRSGSRDERVAAASGASSPRDHDVVAGSPRRTPRTPSRRARPRSTNTHSSPMPFRYQGLATADTAYEIRTSPFPRTSRRPVTGSGSAAPGHRGSCRRRCRGTSGWFGVRRQVPIDHSPGLRRWSTGCCGGRAATSRRNFLAHQLLVAEVALPAPRRRPPMLGVPLGRDAAHPLVVRHRHSSSATGLFDNRTLLGDIVAAMTSGSTSTPPIRSTSR